MGDISFENYTKKQMHDLYLEAMCGEVTDPRLEKVKEALYELVRLGQYNYDSFQLLVEKLLELPDKALHDIKFGIFGNFYKLHISNVGGSEDYQGVVTVLEAIYTDYTKIADINEYLHMCDCLCGIYYYHGLKDKRVDECLSRANNSLNELLRTTLYTTDYDTIKTKRSYVVDDVARLRVKIHLLVSFLIYEEEYNHSYHLPANLYNYMIGNYSEDDIIKISFYLQYGQDRLSFSKELLDTYYNACSNNLGGSPVMDKIEMLSIRRIKKLFEPKED